MEWDVVIQLLKWGTNATCERVEPQKYCKGYEPDTDKYTIVLFL